jgi:pSer/pThr/pTyr-binding forkhead associated (FHA) protein
VGDFQIRVYPGTPEEFLVELDSGERLRIGRKREQQPVRKLILDDKSVSGTHAEIWSDGYNWRITDRMSTNGTFLNGKPCASGEEYILRHGDEVRIAHIPMLIAFCSQEETFRLDAIAVSEDQFSCKPKLQAMPVQELPDLEEDE